MDDERNRGKTGIHKLLQEDRLTQTHTLQIDLHREIEGRGRLPGGQYHGGRYMA